MRSAFTLMMASVMLYAVNGTIDYVVVRSLPLSYAIISIGFGILIGFIATKFVFRLRVKAETKGQYAFGIITAFMITAYTLPLLIAYKSYTLASIYPLIGLSALVFFAIDAIKYRRSLKLGQTAMLLMGVLLIIIGIFYAESNGYRFQLSTLPFIFLITVFAGIGYYMEFYRIKKYSIGTKMLFQPIFLIATGLFFAWPVYALNIYFALGIFGGFAFAFASVMELRAMKMTKARGKANMLIKRNFINDFEYSDTLLVLLGSVIIGSFYPVEIFGGILIVAGIIVISWLSNSA